MATIIDFFGSMSGWLLILCYLILAVAVIYVTSRLSDCVDKIDKLTKIGGAFIGGIFLAAVTSLPELITSISAISVLKEPDPNLIFGNIFGSNLFNLLILAIVNIIFIKHMFMNKVQTMRKTNLFTMIMYMVILLPIVVSFILKISGIENYNILNFPNNFIKISYISIAILIIYVFSVKVLAKDKPKEINETDNIEIINNKNKGLTKQIILFAVFGTCLVLLSVIMTIVVDTIAEPGKLTVNGLSSGLAGALFLASATSLPETTAIIKLVKLRNYDAAVGNIIGSNVFNFTIISVVDVISFNKINLFANILGSDSQSIIIMLVIGFLCSAICMFMLWRNKSRNKFVYILPSILIIVAYVVFLALTV